MAIANEAGVELGLADFDRISSADADACDLKPGGRFVAVDSTRRRRPGRVKRLQELGRLNETRSP